MTRHASTAAQGLAEAASYAEHHASRASFAVRRRDALIMWLWREGASIRAIAEIASLTPGRVQQIIDRDRRANESRAQNRELSRELLAAHRRKQTPT